MGEDVLSTRTAQHWFNRFKNGNFELDDLPQSWNRSGRTGQDRTGPDEKSNRASQDRIFTSSSLLNFSLYPTIFRTKNDILFAFLS
jgi:hypothetical protein